MSRERLWDLLADRATQGLSDLEARELDALLRQYPDIDPEELDRAAAAADLALSRAVQPMPASLRDRIARSIPVDAPPVAVIGPRRTGGRLAWVAAAACLALAVAGWWSSLLPAPSLNTQRQSLLAAAGTIRLPWGEWSDPDVKAEIKGIKGEVVWNEREQRGFMTFSGLPAADPAKQVYQLWIIDERGMGQRISGGIFDASGTGEIVVPITPQIKTRNAAAFAITIEAPGGTWVSDMKRRVVIAAPKAG